MHGRYWKLPEPCASSFWPSIFKSKLYWGWVVVLVGVPGVGVYRMLKNCCGVENAILRGVQMFKVVENFDLSFEPGHCT